MRADFKVVLDACVLANFGVCDLFLRLADAGTFLPSSSAPSWSKTTAGNCPTGCGRIGFPCI
jgi:hypothetical protein